VRSFCRFCASLLIKFSSRRRNFAAFKQLFRIVLIFFILDLMKMVHESAMGALPGAVGQYFASGLAFGTLCALV